MGARLMTFGIWAAVLACAAAWALPLFTRSTPVPAGASLAVPAPPAGGSLVRLLGQPPAAPVEEAPVVVAASRFQLVGVVAPRQGGARGLALIAVDGKPAKPIGVGREVEPGLTLLSVAHRQVELGPAGGAPSVTLNLAPLPEAQRGRPDGLLPGLVPGGPPGALPGAGAPAGLPGAPGVMRVPPMPGSGQVPAVQPPRALPGAALPQGLPQGLSRQGLIDGQLAQPGDGSPPADPAPGGGLAGAMR